ncbi:MAG: hypothetical protein ACPG05_04840 [Bdellovibrionales bacterium]
MIRKLNIDQTNIALMLVSLAVAFVLPFEMVLISYAFLGPAHYLTQISWMHDRNYFVDSKWLWLPFFAIVIVLAVSNLTSSSYQDPISYGTVLLALMVSVSMLATKNMVIRGAIVGGSMLFFMLLQTTFTTFSAIVIVLVPTVIHIYVFTGAFILNGAIKSKSRWGALSFVVFLLCGVAFIFISPLDIKISQNFVSENIHSFEITGYLLASVLSLKEEWGLRGVLGFLSFAYTYHYLNWFSKVELIKWHLIPKKRMGVIIALYVLSVGIYLIDYRTGLSVLFVLSMLHVFLEFPLNVLTFKSIFAFKR